MATEVKRDRGYGRRVRVGALVLIAIGFLVLAVYQVGRIFNVFSSRYELVTLVPTAAGLREGAAVTLAGQRVGQLREIEFIPLMERTDTNNVSMILSVDEELREQIRENSRAYIRSQGLLGDKYIDISPGTRQYAVLEAGDTIPSGAIVDLETVLATASSTLEEAQLVLADIRGITGPMTAGEGTMGRLLRDDVLYERMIAATTELAVLLNSINESEGTFGRLIHDPTFYQRATGALAALDTLTTVALHSDGTLARLLRDDSLYVRAVGSMAALDSALIGVNQLVVRLNAGDGTLSRLLEDPELYDQLLKSVIDLQTLIIDIRENPGKYAPPIQVEVF
ncbi:MAG: MlaD family protein [Longimicrobiales bacterium]